MTTGLKCFFALAAVSLGAFSALGQHKELVDVPWAPPADLDPPGSTALRPTVPQPMIQAIRVGEMSIRLERTELAAVRERFGGEQGLRGDGSTSLGWLCYAGEDAGGRWALWVTSGEIDGPSVGSFEWRRVAERAHFDPRCAQLPLGTDITLSLIPLRLGMDRSRVFSLLGQPTVGRGNILDYEHNHQNLIRHEPYTFWNSVAVRLLHGTVDSIRATETDAN